MTTSKSVNKISPSDGKSQIWTFLSAHHSLYTGLNNAIRIVIKHSHAGWQVADIQLMPLESYQGLFRPFAVLLDISHET